MIKTGLQIIVIFFTSTLFLNTYAYAFHENLGIDDNKASELYRTNPNDPAIAQWKNALQSEINGIEDNCFDIRSAFLCENSMLIIISNCVSHPNTLLACNDSRYAQFPTILIQSKALKAEEANRTHYEQIQSYGNNMLDNCIIGSINDTSKFDVAGETCNNEIRSLQGECRLVNNTYNFCKDNRFVGFLAQHNLLNSTDSS